jgi:hypothetical protein
MSALIKSLASWSAKSDRLWELVEPTLVKFSQYVLRERRRYEQERYAGRSQPSPISGGEAAPPFTGRDKAISEIFPELTVAHGPFTGLRYPRGKAYGSALFPKLLGSYEKELHTVISNIIATPYTDIVDIGCAEGYYANGFAQKMPNTTVHAYDINEDARNFCSSMAYLNQQTDRVALGQFCSANTLLNFPHRSRTLILSDCEGYEKKLFTPEVCQSLAAHDVLIEVHDFLDLSISPQLHTYFAPTHDLELIESIDDVQKVHTYDYAELAGFDLEAKRELVGEFRPAIMQWFFFRSKNR